MTKQEREMRSMRAFIAKGAQEVRRAQWALHKAHTALANAQWRLSRAGVTLEGFAKDLDGVRLLGEHPMLGLKEMYARARALALVLGVRVGKVDDDE